MDLPMKRKVSESTWDDPTYRKMMKSNSKSPGDGNEDNGRGVAKEEEEEVYDPTLDGEDDGGDNAIDKPEANVINHWKIGGGREMPDPNAAEESREFGDEVFTGGKEKMKSYIKPK